MNKQEAIERIEKLDEHYGISQGVYLNKRDVVSIISQIDEPQKLYTVEIPDPHGMYKIRYLFRTGIGNIRIGGANYRDIFLDAETHLTESEIKKDFEWAWDAGFAKEVEL